MRKYSVSNEGDYYMSKELEAHRSKGGIGSLLMITENTLLSGGDRQESFLKNY